MLHRTPFKLQMQATKPCSVCGRPFVPVRPLQRVCGLICARKVPVIAKKQERETDRKRKEAAKRLRDLMTEAQAAFNVWVRARDAQQPCISCNAPPPNLEKLHAGRDAGHYRSVGAARHLRFHEDNVHAQCVHCNQHKAGNAVDYRIGLVARIGTARVEALETDNAVRKWKHDELRAIRDTYRAKLKELQAKEPA